jgi:anti-anti-sigma regulatory factor
VKPILIIVINQDFDEGNISEIREYINKPIKNKEYINLFVIRENEIENLDKYKIFNLFDL